MKTKLISGIAVLTIVILAALQWQYGLFSLEKEEPFLKDIGAQESKKLLEKGELRLILDVRSPREYNGPMGHLPKAQSLPLQELPNRLIEIEDYKDQNIAVICHSGKRSRLAANLLFSKGFNKVYNIVGGTLGWVRSGLPVDKN